MKPWLKRSESLPLDFHIFKVRTLEVEDPRNARRYPRVVLDCPDWVNVIPVTSHGEVVLVRQFRFGRWSPTLELPGGMVDPKEAPAAAALRELEEETGYRGGRLTPLGDCEPNPAFQNNRMHHFLATGCERAHGGAPDDSEDLEVELVPVADIEKKVKAGELKHALVLTALYLWRLSGPVR